MTPIKNNLKLKLHHYSLLKSVVLSLSLSISIVPFHVSAVPPFSASISVDDEALPPFDSGAFFKIMSGQGYQLIGSSQVTLPSSETWPVPSLIRFDENGDFLYSAFMDNGGAAFDQELIGDRDDTARFFAGFLNQDAQAIMSIYDGETLQPDFAVAADLITTPQKSGLSFFPGKISVLIQDAGTYLRLLTLNSSGETVISSDYSSEDLLGQEVPGFSTQTVKISQLPDETGFYISIQWSQLDISNPLSFQRNNRFILIKTDNSGAVSWARKFDLMSGISPLQDISAPVDNNGYLYRITDVEVSGQSSATHTKVIRINADGSLGFAIRIENARLSSIAPAEGSNNLFLGGSLTDPGNPISADSVFIDMNSESGEINSSMVINQGPFDSGSISGVTQSHVFVQNVGFSGDPSNTDSADIDLIRVDRNFTNPVGVRFQGNSTFGSLFAISDTELIFSPFNETNGTIGAYALNGAFEPLVQDCEQFEAIELSITNPQLMVTPQEVDLSDSAFDVTGVDNLLVSADLPVAAFGFSSESCGSEEPPTEDILLSISIIEDGAAVQLEFPTVIGISYDIKRASSVDGEFVSMAVIEGTGETAVHQDDTGPEQGFYQVTSASNQ
jgi:hypothetical protein